MIWTTMLIDRALTDADLIAGVSAVFGVHSTEIGVVEVIGPKSFMELGDVAIVIERRAVAGEFRQIVNYRFRRDAIIREFGNKDATLAAAKRLCAAWSRRCLIEDDESDVTRWRLVLPDGSTESVILDSDALDRDEFMIDRPGVPVTV